MLRKLLKRDLLLHGRMLLISYGLFLAFQLYTVLNVESARTWAVFASIYASFLSITVFAREDKFQSAAWTCTLPVTRREIVRVRFLGAWLLVTAAMVAATMIAAVTPWSIVRPSEVLRPDTLLVSAAVVTLVVALMLPFLIRFGLLGVMIFLVATQMLGAALLVVAVAFRRRGSGSLRLDLSAIGDAVGAVHAALPWPVFAVLVLAVLAFLNWGGYRAAVWLYQRREL